jgi:hypothetical protein
VVGGKKVLRRNISQILRVEVQNGDCDVIAEETHNVGRQREQMKESRVVDAIISAAEGIANEVCRRVFINGF